MNGIWIRYLPVCLFLIAGHSNAVHPTFSIAADIPLGPSSLSSSCMAIATDSNNITYALGNSFSNNNGFIWLAKVNSTGTLVSHKSIFNPDLILHNKTRPVVKDMLILNDQIFALLECEDNSRLAGTSQLALLHLSKNGIIVTNHLLSSKAINAHMIQLNDDVVWIIGQNKSTQQLLVNEISLENPIPNTMINISPDNMVATNGAIKDIIITGSGKCALLIECYNSILDRRLQLLSLDRSGVINELAPPFDGSGGVLSRHKHSVVSLVYRAPTLHDLNNEMFKYYNIGHVAVYNINSSTLHYDERLNSRQISSSDEGFPVFGIDNEKVAVSFVSTNQVEGKMLYLSSRISSIRISRQYSDDYVHYLLVNTTDWDKSKQKGEIFNRVTLLMIRRTDTE